MKEHLDAVLLQETTQTSDQAIDGLVLSGKRRGPVETRLLGDHSELSGMRDRAEHLGHVQPLFGGDTSPDETGPARTLVVDQSDGQPEVMGVKGRGVTARPASDYDDVVQPLPFGGTAGPSLVVPGVTLPEPMQTRWLLIASAALAFLIVAAAAVWFLVRFM